MNDSLARRERAHVYFVHERCQGWEACQRQRRVVQSIALAGASILELELLCGGLQGSDGCGGQKGPTERSRTADCSWNAELRQAKIEAVTGRQWRRATLLCHATVAVAICSEGRGHERRCGLSLAASRQMQKVFKPTSGCLQYLLQGPHSVDQRFRINNLHRCRGSDP